MSGYDDLKSSVLAHSELFLWVGLECTLNLCYVSDLGGPKNGTTFSGT